ncbi:phosphonopyruvate decarboxylase [Thermomonospora echinospora]|uniref:Phosphonopyruvate decarboxylase n=1 Tax=Thermomonospora echinospora TaxID=1992 RepID=A0A1H6DVY5_9ACTN|nr:phosphonopyruvate decarboxylase [Thermomonospora echinospora]SEG89418.1 phosphonopyruvate decarboxylase [Thermomonospora echinospora]
MIDPVECCRRLKLHGCTYFSGVPCSYFASLLQALDLDPGMRYVEAANEGSALATAAGVALAGGRPVVVLQNSGLGNLVNPLTSLSAVFDLPALLLVSWRGCPDEPADEPQHRIMGAATPRLLRLLQVPYWLAPPDTEKFNDVLEAAVQTMLRSQRPVALLFRRGTFSPVEPAGVPPAVGGFTRRDAVAVITRKLTDRDALVATTGMISRELFRQRDRPANFYMQGSMGHAGAIGLGLALKSPGRRVVVVDGDGAAIMHLGSLSVIGSTMPPNLVHIILDNAVYESTGGQRTSAARTDFSAVGRACGYRQAHQCSDAAALAAVLDGAAHSAGPTLIHVKITPDSGTKPARVATELLPREVKERFRKALREDIEA